MENQLHLQSKLSDQKEKAFNKIKENLNYIYIVLILIVNILVGMLTIEDGSVGLHYPKTILGWVMWVIQIALQTTLGVLILNAFRRQGIKIGHDQIKETYNAYLKAIQKDKKTKPRSLKEYMRGENLKAGISKSLIYTILSVFVGSVVIGYNLNNVLSLLINCILAIGFGINCMLQAEQFVLTELIVWYQIKTAEVTNHIKTEPAKGVKNNELRKHKKRTKSRVGYAEPGGIQQTEECIARQENIDPSKSSDTTIDSRA